MTMARSGGRFPEPAIGAGFYKLGYVTNDRELAIERLGNELGIEAWVPFEPSFDAELSGGRRGRADLRCAFSSGRPLFVEVMQPVAGEVSLWADALASGPGFQLQFHHLGLLVDELEPVRAEAAERGIEIPLQAHIEGSIEFAYLKPHSLGHHLEVARQYGDAADWLEAVRSGSIGATA